MSNDSLEEAEALRYIAKAQAEERRAFVRAAKRQPNPHSSQRRPSRGDRIVVSFLAL